MRRVMMIRVGHGGLISVSEDLKWASGCQRHDHKGPLLSALRELEVHLRMYTTLVSDRKDRYDK